MRWLASAAQLFLWLVIGFWLFVGAGWGLLNGWIVPRIEEFRPRLEQEAGKALAMTVRIGNITAHSSGLLPSFELRDTVLVDAQGREALRLPHMLATVSPSSLWRLGLEQLVIDQPVLDIRRTKDGKVLVGGVDVSQPGKNDHAAADWFFSQHEVALTGGTVRWTDEMRGAAAVELSDVNAVVRNSSRRHLMRLDATPPADWGGRFSLRGIFRQPFLSTDAGRWTEWSGKAYADFSRVDVSQLRQQVDLSSFDIRVDGGSGAVRAWADLRSGKVVDATADIALAGVSAQLDKDLEPLALDIITGRFGLQQQPGSFAISTERLDFRTREGLQWPGGNIELHHQDPQGDTAQKTELKADRLDLSALAQIAKRLPLGADAHALIASYSPKGLVEKIDASWQGPASEPQAFAAKGKATALELAALPASAAAASATARPQPGRPGVSGASIEFDMTQDGGKALIKLDQGAIDLPGIFEDPRIAFDRLSMDAQWKTAGGKTDVQMRNVEFANDDAAGSAQVQWHSGAPTADESKGSAARTKVARTPEDLRAAHVLGVLDLQGSLSRGNGASVHRYLPLVMDQEVRHYVRDAVVKGELTDVTFKVKGAVDDIPFAQPSQGEFKISGRVRSGQYAYVPPGIQPARAAPWPALSDLNGELVFNRASLEINGATGRFMGATGTGGADALASLQVVKADARIPDLMHAATVEVNGTIKGPLASALLFVNTSPLAGITNSALEQTKASGPAEYALKLSLPLAALEKSRVRGTVTLPGNDVQLLPAAPPFTALKGSVTFSEAGFAVPTAQAKFLGGDIRFEGGSRTASRDRPGSTAPEQDLLFKAQGSLTAEGLRQIKDEGKNTSFISHVATNASGGTSYAATLGFRRGVAEVTVSSNLQGLSLGLPAPLNKTAESALAVRFERVLSNEQPAGAPAAPARGQPLHDRLSLNVGSLASVVYLRDLSGAAPDVLTGAISVGLEAGESTPLPEDGVAANINLANVDLDAWAKALSQDEGMGTASNAAAPRPIAGDVSEYLPNRMAIRAKELVIGGRKLNGVVVGGSREGRNWRANIDADELNGYLEFSQARGAGSGRVFARLARLRLGQNNAADVETLLAEQPASIPSLDIIVDDLELRGRKLGRIEIAAVNRGAYAVAREGGEREWRLNKFNVTLPEAVLTATGNWVDSGIQSASANAQGAASGVPGKRRTALNFKLDIADSGELLARFGMKDVIRRGKGKMEGQVAWIGSPLSLDYPTMSGKLNVNVESGQFLKADPGIAKLLGVLSLQALPRRLTLDFRDVFSAGFAFDFVRGDVNIRQGVAETNNLQMKGVNAAVLMEGSADLARETQDLKVVIVPEINAGTASLIATVINPAIGLGTFLAQYFLRQPLIRANTQEFHIDGRWTDPRITKVDYKP